MTTFAMSMRSLCVIHTPTVVLDKHKYGVYTTLCSGRIESCKFIISVLNIANGRCPRV